MNLKPALIAVAGGVANAAAVGGPLLDDGVKPSDVAAMIVAFFVGTGLTAVPGVVRKAKVEA